MIAQCCIHVSSSALSPQFAGGAVILKPFPVSLCISWTHRCEFAPGYLWSRWGQVHGFEHFTLHGFVCCDRIEIVASNYNGRGVPVCGCRV